MVTSKKYHEAIIGAGMLEENLKKEELLVVYDQIFDIYLEYRAELVDAMAKTTPVSGASSSGGTLPSTGQTSSGIRLPRIDLPKFDGSYVTWRGFHDRFLALVHNTKALDEIDKLHFLQSCLIGDANRFLQNISVEAANYQKAWELLEERYDHKRILVHIQMQNLFGQPSQTRETASGLQELLYTTRECYLALENMDVPVSTWDTVLIWFIVQKLPSTTQKLWEEKLGNRKELPKFKELTEFSETRFRTLEVVGQQELGAAGRNKNEQTVNSKPRFQPAKSKSFLVKQSAKQPSKPVPKTNTVEQLVCMLCNQEKHSLKRCQQFLNMDNVRRRDVVRRLKVCENCLSYRHSLHECPSSTSCYFCQQRHNTLLHTNQPSSSTHTPQQQPQPAATSAQANVPSSNALYSSVNPNAPEFQPMGQQQQQSFNYHTSHGDRFTTHQVLLATAVVKARSADGRLRL
ncbi:uncharacterized protein LOC129907036 [Episyrphus balteatus]|uniref:uncharacterized protein LOC129907036 n=1 Tax=Episyrphus balteatus TaxID=286459 RepID=UPI0024869F28|nr:uncharacterized protein LOC129907036 [Episyrphus balteatus]